MYTYYVVKGIGSSMDLIHAMHAPVDGYRILTCLLSGEELVGLG